LSGQVFGFMLLRMKALAVSIGDDGVLKLPPGLALPSGVSVAVLVLESDEPGGLSISSLAEASGAFDFLKEEPEIYSDRDILPGRANPRFRK
jgi:hypothetical protein